MDVLVTGFEPFGTYEDNPSAELAKALDGLTHLGYRFNGVVLPVSSMRASSILRKLLRGNGVSLAIHFGLAAKRNVVTFEKVAINVLEFPIPDNDGVVVRTAPVVSHAAAAYFSTLPVEQLAVWSTARGIEAQVSYSAGTYLCNQIMFESLWVGAWRKTPLRSGFVHLPPRDGLSMSALIEMVLELPSICNLPDTMRLQMAHGGDNLRLGQID